MAPTVPIRELYIAGKWQAPVLGGRLDIINPSSEEVVGTIAAGTKEDVDLAVKAARAAYTRNRGRDWPRLSGAERATYLRAMAEKLEEKKLYLAELEALDSGKPLDETKQDVDDVAGCFEYYADLAEKLDKQQDAVLEIPDSEGFVVTIRKEALGVAALITPWNYPLLMGAWKVAPALAAGCTCVLKPSELASITCLELAAIADEVKLPAGALNVITGLGSAAGAALTSHPGIDKITFTGSSNTGKMIMQEAAKQLKPVTMELGGKSAIIVFDDVDIEKAVEWTLFGCFWTNGQICSATSRLLIHEKIAPAFKQRMVEWAQNIKIADPFEDKCRLGPVVSAGQHQKVLKFIDDAVAEGAKVLHGGKRPAHLSKGYFLEPTILEVTPSMSIWTEEVFGPVLSVVTFSSEEEAVDMANDSEYALAGAVLSADEERTKRVSEALDVGVVWINCSQPAFNQAPWGGKRKSGFGRELGVWGFENYLSVKQVTKYTSKDAWDWYPPPPSKL